MKIHSKVALITGASKGIGLQIANAFISAGYRVVFNSRSSENLIEAIGKRKFDRVVAVPGDVTCCVEAKSIVSRVIDKFGRIDSLICNVGSGRSVPPGNECSAEWMRMLSLNLISSTNMVEAAKNSLAITQGSIVCISSICGLQVIPGAPVTYSVAKAALNAYIKGIARPLASHGVRINGVAPGNIMFPGSVWAHKMNEDANAVAQMIQNEVPIGRLGVPEDVANLVLWLSSTEAKFITGNVYVVDGGQIR